MEKENKRKKYTRLPTSKIPIYLYIFQSQLEYMQGEAERLGTSKSDLIRRAITLYQKGMSGKWSDFKELLEKEHMMF